MTDPVNAADVLTKTWLMADEVRNVPDAHRLSGEQVDALLAYGDGDPVVIMPDGTLRRLTEGGDYDPSMRLTDPVQP